MLDTVCTRLGRYDGPADIIHLPTMLLSLFLTLAGFAAGIRPSLPDPEPQTLRIKIVDAQSGEAHPAAQVAWLSESLHDEKRKERPLVWPWRREGAAEQYGQKLVLDAEGSARFETPGSHVFVVARTHTGYGFAHIAEDAGEFTIRIFEEIEIAVRAVDPDGEPVAGIHAWLASGEPTGPLLKGTRWRSRTVLDKNGEGQFAGMRYLGFTNTEITDAAFEKRNLHLVLDVLGHESVAFKLTREAWDARQLHVVTPPIGYLELLPSMAGGARYGMQSYFIKQFPPSPNRDGSMGYSSRMKVQGRYFSASRLNLKFEAFANGGLSVSTARMLFSGPTTPREHMTIGPLEPEDHIKLTMTLNLPPEGLQPHKDQILVRMLQRESSGPWGRIWLGRSTLPSDGVIEIWVPESCATIMSDGLQITLGQAGQVFREVTILGGFGAQRAFHVNLDNVAGWKSTESMRPIPEPLRERWVELQVSLPSGADFKKRSIRARWVRLCEEPGKRTAQTSWRSFHTNNWGRFMMSKPRELEGPWMLSVYTPELDQPSLYTQVVLDPQSSNLQSITLQELLPFAAGILLDDAGTPLVGLRLHLKQRPGKPAPRGPAVTAVTDENGRFEFTAMPELESAAVQLSGPSDLVLDVCQGVTPGTLNLRLKATRLGAVSFEVQLPPNARLWDLEAVLLKGQEPQILRSYPDQEPPRITAVHIMPGEYRLRISLPKGTQGPDGRLSDSERVLHESAPFLVEPASKGLIPIIPAIDLSRSFRRITVHTTAEGQESEAPVGHISIRSPHGRPLAFWSKSWNRDPRTQALIIEPRRAFEIVARDVVHRRDSDENSSGSYMTSKAQLVTGSTTQVDLHMAPTSKVQFRFDPDVLDLAGPYQLHALIRRGEVSKSSPWKRVGDPFDYHPTSTCKVGPDGGVTFSDLCSLPGERLPDRIYVALVFQPAEHETDSEPDLSSTLRSGGSPSWSYPFFFDAEKKAAFRDATESVTWIEFVRDLPETTAGKDVNPNQFVQPPAAWFEIFKGELNRASHLIHPPTQCILNARKAIDTRAEVYK